MTENGTDAQQIGDTVRRIEQNICVLTKLMLEHYGYRICKSCNGTGLSRPNVDPTYRQDETKCDNCYGTGVIERGRSIVVR